MDEPLFRDVLGVLVGLAVAARLGDVALVVAPLVLVVPVLVTLSLVAVAQVAALLAALRVVGLLSAPRFVSLAVLVLTGVLVALVRPVPLLPGAVVALVAVLAPLEGAALLVLAAALLGAPAVSALVGIFDVLLCGPLMVRLLRRRAVMGRSFRLVLSLGPSLQAGLVLLLVTTRRSGVTPGRLVVPVLPGLVAVLLGLPMLSVGPVTLLVGPVALVGLTVSLVAGLMLAPLLGLPVALLLVGMVALPVLTASLPVLLAGRVAALICLARLGARSLAQLSAAGLLLVV